MKLIVVILLIILIWAVYTRCIEKPAVIAIPIPHPTPIKEGFPSAAPQVPYGNSQYDEFYTN